MKDKTVDVNVYLKRSQPDGLDGGTDAGHDTGHDTGHDAGAHADAATDSGADTGTDAGEHPDSSDASGLPDVPDAEVPDTGPVDAGSTDSAVDDAGIDAGLPDTGADAECVPDCAGKCGGDDGCQGTCTDNCVPPDSCGGGGALSVCGCTQTPRLTACLNKCGSVSDGCAGTWSCGDCSDGYSCQGNACVCASAKLCTGGICCPNATDACHNGLCCAPQCAGVCGGVSDACGGQCTGCPSSHLCVGSACVHCGDRGEQCCYADTCNGANACKDAVCVPTDCTGLADFTTCDVVTTPDRKYDICVGGACVSPGCGDASCNTPGPHFPIPDTGQRKCYNDTAEIACPTGATGVPCDTDGSPAYCGQDAQYGWDKTHQATDRFTVIAAVADEPVVTDTVTGMQWQGCPAGLKGTDCLTGTVETKTWDEGLMYCDGLNWGGQTGWRLPDHFELYSIVNLGSINPAIDNTAFPATPYQSATFWSSTVFAEVLEDPLFVDYSIGIFMDDDPILSMKNIRCVRGVPLSVPSRFVRNNSVLDEPTVTDNITGLVWQGCIAGLSGDACDKQLEISESWSDGLKYCEWLNWGGMADWRLPSVMEMVSITDVRRIKPAINVTAFPGTPNAAKVMFWTSSTCLFDTTQAWVVLGGTGAAFMQSKTGVLDLRCVRTGP